MKKRCLNCGLQSKCPVEETVGVFICAGCERVNNLYDALYACTIDNHHIRYYPEKNKTEFFKTNSYYERVNPKIINGFISFKSLIKIINFI